MSLTTACRFLTPLIRKSYNTKKFCKLAQKLPVASFEEVKNAQGDKNVLVIDVREPAELKETGVLPGSINIPLAGVESALNMSKEQFRKNFGRDKPTSDVALIFSCHAGIRGATAQETAIKLGFRNVKNYEGAWLDWEKKVKQ